MTDNTQQTRTRPIVSISEFKQLSDTERRQAYVMAYRSLHNGAAPYPDTRRALLKQYVAIAGWDDESVATMQAVAITPVR